MKGGTEGETAHAPPWLAARERMLAQAEAWERAGQAPDARALRGIVDEWWPRQERWNERIEAFLELHHEINNALVGVRGNVQLMLMNPAGQSPGLREKLEVVLRESGRIQEATARLRDLKSVLGGAVHRPRAA